MRTIIVWFRKDLRLSDNPALIAAIKNAEKIVPLYIDEQDSKNPWPMGAAQKWWLHHSLQSLQQSLKQKQSKLILRRGKCLAVLQKLIRETRADAVYWNRCYEPYALARDAKIKNTLEEAGITINTFQASLLFEPWTIKNSQGNYFKVYTPFYKHCLKLLSKISPLLAPKKITTSFQIKSERLSDWNLLPTQPDWAKTFESYWQVGEAAAIKKCESFLQHHVSNYAKTRDIPGEDGVSQLSPHLHFGEISPAQIWQAAEIFKQHDKKSANGINKFLSQIIWREFSYYLLYHFPKLPDKNFRAAFDRFKWKYSKKNLTAWQQGKTGYPIVDAGMQQLWQTGWMHNRVRMIVASFLIKDLLIDWRKGEKWFWDTLVDADLANNAASWQWVAGSGADAAPYFRIFNPILQGEKFDPDGKYIRQWLAPLKFLPDKYIHQPWTAPAGVLTKAKIKLGENYPKPIINHAMARERALKIYKAMNKKVQNK